MFHLVNLAALYFAAFFFETAYAVMDFFHSMGVYI